jgi:hypothetical protein
MPPKEKQRASGFAEKKPASKPAPAKPAQEEMAATREGRISKPDQAAYQAGQDALKKEIDDLTPQLVCPCQAIASERPAHPNGRTLSRTRLMGLREAPEINERMS